MPAGNTTETTVFDPPVSSCAGALIGGSCWYYGAQAESCTNVCSTHAGYDVATATYAGSSAANCEAVLDVNDHFYAM